MTDRISRLSDFRRREIGLISEMTWRDYSVLVPLVKAEEGLSVLFEERSSRLAQQPDEISFPGGAVEEGESFEEAAVRETAEELLIEGKRIRVFGPGDILIASSSRKIHSFIGRIEDYDGSYSEEEVKEVFSVPLDRLMAMEPELYRNKLTIELDKNFPYRDIPNGLQYKWNHGDHVIYFYRWQGRVIWGITAKILYSSLQLIKEYRLDTLFEEGW